MRDVNYTERAFPIYLTEPVKLDLPVTHIYNWRPVAFLLRVTRAFVSCADEINFVRQFIQALLTQPNL